MTKKRKYTKPGETPSAYECSKKRCKWQGLASEKSLRWNGSYGESLCPNCGNAEFYGLIEKPIKNENKMKKIYVASSWRNQDQQLVVALLRGLGHEVYDFKNPPSGTGFAWSAIDPNWENWTFEEYKAALQHPLAIAGFDSDFDAMKWADCCVMVLPCGRSANTEAGWMKGAGKEVYVYQPIDQEPELMYKIYDGIFDTVGEILEQMK